MTMDPFDEMIRSKVEELDGIYPPQLSSKEMLWQALLKKQVDRKARKKMVWSVAASLLVLVTAAYLLTFNLRTRDTQGIPTDAALPRMLSAKTEALAYINRRCVENRLSCTSPVIQELRQDLDASFVKLNEIDEQIRLYGNDASLVRARTRVENHQSRVI